jgi:hypothetical protein
MRLARRVVMVCLAAASISAFAQNNPGFSYLWTYTVQVKPEKRAEYNTIMKKLVAANRKDGDNWLAEETDYGEDNVLMFVEGRQSFADADAAQQKFYAALAKSYGQAGAEKLMQDANACIISARSEMRLIRPEISVNVPDTAQLNRMVGQSRWVRTIMVRVRPGKNLEFEAMVKQALQAIAGADPSTPVLVAQSVAGQAGLVYYISTLKPKLGDYDGGANLAKLLGDEEWRKWLKTDSEVVISSSTYINRFVPELSNPLPDIVAASADFWSPKTTKAAKPKPASAAKQGQ